jgi:hypothetical protein
MSLRTSFVDSFVQKYHTEFLEEENELEFKSLELIEILEMVKLQW